MGKTEVLPNNAALVDLAGRINTEHEACRSAMQKGLEHALEAGRLLLEAKKGLSHGEWLPWVKENCPDISERSAQRYMRFTENRGELESKTANVADLTIQEADRLLTAPRESEKRPWWETAPKDRVAWTCREWPDVLHSAAAYMDADELEPEEIAERLNVTIQEVECAINPKVAPNAGFKALHDFPPKFAETANQFLQAEIIGRLAGGAAIACGGAAWQAEQCGRTNLASRLKRLERKHWRESAYATDCKAAVESKLSLFDRAHIYLIALNYTRNAWGLEKLEGDGSQYEVWFFSGKNLLDHWPVGRSAT